MRTHPHNRQVILTDKYVIETAVAGSVNPIVVEIKHPRTYKVLTDGHSRWADGTKLGVVTYKRDGWYFLPAFPRLPSRKGHPTPEAALKGRVAHYRLESVLEAT